MQVLGEVAIITEKYHHDFSTVNRIMVLSILLRLTKVDASLMIQPTIMHVNMGLVLYCVLQDVTVEFSICPRHGVVHICIQ